jgi:ABC-type Mn2+/Zn2+ transport systems, permease components
VGSNVLADRGLRSFAMVAGLSWAARRSAWNYFHRHRHGADGFARNLCRRSFSLDLESWTTFAIALAFTLTGAAIFSVTGKRTSQIPQEAVIGISYVVAAAAAVLLLSRAAEGDEEIKNMLVGNILLVTPREVWERFALFVAVGIFHFVFRRNFLLVSFDRDGAYQKGLRVRWWDFFFYAVFGLVVTSFVRIAGVLLVFSYLIVPAVCGINLAQRTVNRLLIGWFIALLGGIAGLFLSYWWDLPSGAAMSAHLARCSFLFRFSRCGSSSELVL